MADSYIDYGTGCTLTSDQKSGLFTGVTFDYLSVTHFEVILTKGTTGVKTTLTYATSSAPFAVTTGPPVHSHFRVAADFRGRLCSQSQRPKRPDTTTSVRPTGERGSGHWLAAFGHGSEV